MFAVHQTSQRLLLFAFLSLYSVILNILLNIGQISPPVKTGSYLFFISITLYLISIVLRGN